MGDLSQQLEGLTDQQGRLLKEMEDQTAILKANDERYEDAKARLDKLATEMNVITTERTAKEREAEIERQGSVLADLAARVNARTPSKAALIGHASSPKPYSDGSDFYWSLWASKSTRYPELNAEGKARLAEMGSYWADADPAKATVGDTGANGGNVVPPNVLTNVIEIATARNPYRNLLTVTNAGYVTGVDVPAESIAPIAATIAAAGSTKANLNFTVGKYTATMYTLAAIYDVGNQLLRNSRGAAEQLVRDRLTRAIALGEANYILNGTGTSQPTGILTAIGTSGTFWTSFTPSATTLAGSASNGIATATGVLANRARQADGVVVNAADFWTLAAQGTDTAGFFMAPAAGPTVIDPTQGQLRIWGLPVYSDPNMPAKNMVVGEWKSATLFTGQTYRVDVSDTAGTRWDTNETGFRGEEEIAFNATPYVVSGLFQRVSTIVP